MSRPEDKKGVLRMLGIINFIGKFIPNLSSKTVHLRQLLHDRTEFKWTEDHEEEWTRLKTTHNRTGADVLRPVQKDKDIH